MKNLKRQIFSKIETLDEHIIDIRHDLHKNPELSGHEEDTKYLLKGILESVGYKITESDKHFGLIADLVVDETKKRIAIRADMDALPIEEQTKRSYSSKKKGVMHACGHDSHTAIALGCALAFIEFKDRLPGNIRFIFQPSEESKDGGSKDMIEEGCLEGVDAILGLHAYPYLNTGQIGYKYGVMMASADVFSVEVFGKSSHGARPHEGVDAILVTGMIVNSLNHIVSRRIDPLHPAVISLGTIKGGQASNIICDHVLFTGTVRTVNEEIRKNIPKMMEKSIEGICSSMGAKYKFDYQFGQPELINNDNIVDIIVKEAKDILGYENCIDLETPVMGGEDFSEYLQIVPGAFFRLGTCDKEKGTCVPQHNSRFDVDDDALDIGMKVMAASALSFLARNSYE